MTAEKNNENKNADTPLPDTSASEHSDLSNNKNEKTANSAGTATPETKKGSSGPEEKDFTD